MDAKSLRIQCALRRQHGVTTLDEAIRQLEGKAQQAEAGNRMLWSHRDATAVRALMRVVRIREKERGTKS